MIVGADHSRLSKRHGATSINQFKEEGYLPSAMLNHLALLSWSPGDDKEKLTVKELTDKFSFKRVSSSPAVFDRKKLDWLNSLYIREISAPQFVEHMIPFLLGAGCINTPVSDEIMDWLKDISQVVKTDLTTFKDVSEHMNALSVYEPEKIASDSEEARILSENGVADFLLALRDEARKDKAVSNEKYREMVMRLMARTERKGKAFFQPIRVALTGRLSGMELDFFVPLVEKGSLLDLPKKIPSCSERLDILFKRFYKNE